MIETLSSFKQMLGNKVEQAWYKDVNIHQLFQDYQATYF